MNRNGIERERAGHGLLSLLFLCSFHRLHWNAKPSKLPLPRHGQRLFSHNLHRRRVLKPPRRNPCRGPFRCEKRACVWGGNVHSFSNRVLLPSSVYVVPISDAYGCRWGDTVDSSGGLRHPVLHTRNLWQTLCYFLFYF